MISRLLKSKTLINFITKSLSHVKNPNLNQSHDHSVIFNQTRTMGGPSSHLKQLKGLVKKVHKVLPLEHPKSIDAMTDYLADELTFQMKHKKQEKVPGCDPNGGYCNGGKIYPWCSFQITFPTKKWRTIFNSRMKLMNELDSEVSEKRNYQKWVLPENLIIYHASSHKRIEDGIRLLVSNMMDPVLSFNFQWSDSDSNVGLIQLSSATYCLLIRASKLLDAGLSQMLVEIFTDPSLVILVNGYNEIDNEKFNKSFGFEKSNFANLCDLKDFARDLGYDKNITLSKLAEKVLNLRVHVPTNLERREWEAARIKKSQAFYAALDVFTIGAIFRQLRYWHCAPMKCRGCNQELGKYIDHKIKCLIETCDASFESEKEHRQHCLEMRHPYHTQMCQSCGRVKMEKDQINLKESECNDINVKKVSREDDDVLIIKLKEKLLKKNDERKESYKKIFDEGPGFINKLYGVI